MRLPPLNAVRAFEVAARLRSIKDAAEELHVTPGAVSRQVKILEEYLDVLLFKRNHREIELTPTGVAYQAALTKHLCGIEDATNDVLDFDTDRPLHVWCSITFSLRWLMPRLHRFQKENDKGRVSDVSFTTSLQPHDLRADRIDIAIRAFGITGNEVIIEPLFSGDILPVCSPRYYNSVISAGKLNFDQYSYLHSKVRNEDWKNWFHLRGISPGSGAKHIFYGSSTLAYEAAMLGHGIALAIRPFIENELRSGALVQPFDEIIEDGAEFFLTYSSERTKRKRVAELRDWVISESRAG